MDLEDFKKIHSIIERDSKNTTYKFALLRGAIDISIDHQHLAKQIDGRITFPLGLLVEKWVLYYYPIISNSTFIPQQRGEKEFQTKQIAFRKLFKEITDHYDVRGGFTVFYQDYLRGNFPEGMWNPFYKLIVKIRDTITDMPMRYLGKSFSQSEYSVFNFEKETLLKSGFKAERNFIVQNLGWFSFDTSLYVVFLYLGNFIAGQDTLLVKWAEFTNSNEPSISISDMMETLGTSPLREHDTKVAREMFLELLKQENELSCVWTGKKISNASQLEIDHVLPFSVWKNNDLWNLLPAHKSINRVKKDKIPSVKLLKENREQVLAYWGFLNQNGAHNRFQQEMEINLTGKIPKAIKWDKYAFQKLVEKCEYLILVRGYEEWDVN